MTVGALPHIAAGRPPGLTGMCTRLVTVACVAFIFRPVARHIPEAAPPVGARSLAVMTPLVLLGWLADTLIGALIRADDVGARFSVAIAR